MAKKIIALMLVLTIVMMPGAFAFSFMGIDFGALWDKITFWNNDDSNKDSNSVKPTSGSGAAGSSKRTLPSPEVKISLAGVDYTEGSLKASVNSNDEMKGYIKGFGYECIFIETDKGTEFTMQFNPSEGTMQSLKSGNSCEREIYLEESLISDISENGFSAKKIKSYLEKVDLPMTMYAKALKVFTIG